MIVLKTVLLVITAFVWLTILQELGPVAWRWLRTRWS